VVARLTASERDLRTLAGVVSQARPDVGSQGLPFSLLGDLRDLIPCDYLLFQGYDMGRQQY
jgi:hypothetical protein